MLKLIWKYLFVISMCIGNSNKLGIGIILMEKLIFLLIFLDYFDVVINFFFQNFNKFELRF
jgi:hypothetical protein